MPLRALAPDLDRAPVSTWLRDYLEQHRAWWSEAYGTPPVADLDELVAREWDDLVADDRKDDHLVRVLEPEPTEAGATGHVPVGVVHARLRRCHFTGLPLGVLAWIYVAPAARGSGAGDRLMEAAGAWMAARGVRGREVFVTSANRAAIRLYERHGYRVTDHRLLGGAPSEG